MWPFLHSAGLAIWGLALLTVFSCPGCVEPSHSAPPTSSRLRPARPAQPESLPIQEVNLRDDQKVIGISVGSKHRAYLVEALKWLPQDPAGGDRSVRGQVINDLVDGIPISVTYDPVQDRCRVLTSPGSQPLNVVAGSVRDNGLELSWNHQTFLQSDPDLPWQDYPFELTDWGTWKAHHPQADVYIGPLDEG